MREESQRTKKTDLSTSDRIDRQSFPTRKEGLSPEAAGADSVLQGNSYRSRAVPGCDRVVRLVGQASVSLNNRAGGCTVDDVR